MHHRGHSSTAEHPTNTNAITITSCRRHSSKAEQSTNKQTINTSLTHLLRCLKTNDFKKYVYQFSRNAILAEQVTSCKIKKTALLNVHFLCDNTFLYSSLSDDSDHKLLAIKSAHYVSLTVLLLLLL